MMGTRLSSSLFGIDTTEYVRASTARAFGAHFVCRYVARSTWKVLGQGELFQLHEAGIGVCLVFEDGAANARLGHNQGVADADFARGQAMDRGFPKGRPIYFAVDFDVAGVPSQTDAYFDGVASVLGHEFTGVYGGIEVVTHQLNRGFDWGWQTLAWSRGFIDARAKMYQSNINLSAFGISYDPDHAYYADFGQSNYVEPKPDPYAIYPTNVHSSHLLNKGNERLTVEQVDGALKHPEKYRTYLKVHLGPALIQYRDRIARVSIFAPPSFTRKRRVEDWSNHRGPRYQLIDERIKRIEKL